MKHKQSNKSILALGLQFTSIMIMPVVVCVLLGSYIQKKYNLGSWFILVMIFLAFLIIIIDIVSYAKLMSSRTEDKTDSGRSNGESKQGNTKRP